MTIVQNVFCDPDQVNPTHHIKLSDAAGNVLGFLLRSGTRVDPRAINRRPRQNGQFSPFTQSDWGSGRGIKDAQSDRSRYADGKRVITRHSGTVMLGGQETYTTGYRVVEQNMPGNVTWQPLLGSETAKAIAYKVTASASGNRSAVYLWVRRRGTPNGNLIVELCSDSTGSPGTVLQSVSISTSLITDTVSQLYEFAFESVQAVTNATDYWVKIRAVSSVDDSTNHWAVGVDAADTNNRTVRSANGVSWVTASYDLYFRLVDDTDLLGGLFFTYKQQLYFLTRPSGSSAPKLYINGDRGVATGTHSITTLQDTTKSWTTNEWAGCTLLIIQGTNSEWVTNYRSITSNTSDTLTFPAFPKASVDSDTVYVILGSNKWTEIAGHGLTVLPADVCDAGEVCYFAQGDSVVMRRMFERIINGAWTRSFAADDANYATFLGLHRTQSGGTRVCKVNNVDNSGQPSFATASTQPWGKRLEFPRLIANCESTTGWTFAANVTGTADPNIFVTGQKSIKMVVGASAATLIAYYGTGTINIRNQKRFRLWVYSSVDADGNELKLRLSAATDASTSIQDISLPAIQGGEWVQVTVSYTDNAAALSGLKSIGILKTTHSGTVYVDGIELLPGGSETPLGNIGESITGLEFYGDPMVPWVFRERSAGSVENGTYNPIPLRELSQAENPHNGVGHLVHNVYLYFSFLHGLERFYRNNMDDVGPNRDEGLPDGRRGFITSMVGYIGRFFYNYDSADGYSAIFESTSGTDHHEIFRSDTAGKRIRNLFVQVIPGNTADRLWFTEGDDVVWLPLPGNTLKEDTDDTFKFTHEGVLETGWIYGNEQDAVKLFSSVKLFTEDTTTNRKVEWDYKIDEDTAWTPVSTSFTSPPVQEVSLNVSAKRIKLRFRLQTNTNSTSPKIRVMVAFATTRPEIRYTYTMNTLLSDAPINKRGDAETSIRADDVLTQLDTWVANNTILTMNSIFRPFNGKSVFLEPVVTNPVTRVDDEKKEVLQATLILVEP